MSYLDVTVIVGLHTLTVTMKNTETITKVTLTTDCKFRPNQEFPQNSAVIWNLVPIVNAQSEFNKHL